MSKTKYKGQESIETAQKLVALGATDKQIASFLKITERAFYKWRERHPEFNDALLEAKEAWDRQVERSLFQRAVGYTTTEDKLVLVDGAPAIFPIRKHVAGNVTAQIFWLKNRQRDKWRDVQQVEDITPRTESDHTLIEVARRLIFKIEQAARLAEKDPTLITQQAQAS